MYNQELRNKVFEDMIYFAAKYRIDKLAKELPTDSEIENPHVFSDEFKNKMKKLIKTHKKLQSRKKYKKSVIILIIILLGTFSLVSNVDAFRTPIVNFFIDIKEEFTKIILHDKDGALSQEYSAIISNVADMYLPTYLPYGYEVADYIAENGTYITTYRNEDGDILLFSQINNSNGVSLDTEGAKFYEIQIDENKAYVFVKDDRLIAVTILERTLLTLSGKIDEPTAIRIMKSVELKK